MSVTSVKHLFDGETATATLNTDNTVVITKVEHWQVTYTTATEADAAYLLVTGATDPVTSLALPLTLGSDNATVGILKLKHVDPKRNSDKPNLFDVLITYETLPNQDRTYWGVDISSKGVPRQEDAHSDKDGKQILNSAHDAFDPPLKKTYYDDEIVVSFNVLPADFALSSWLGLRGKVNSDSVTMTIYGISQTFSAGTLLMQNIDYKTTIGKGTRFFAVSMVMHFRATGWTREVVDRGYRDLIGPILDETGQRKTTYSYLDGSGSVLASGADAVLLPFNVEDTTAFNTVLSAIGN